MRDTSPNPRSRRPSRDWLPFKDAWSFMRVSVSCQCEQLPVANLRDDKAQTHRAFQIIQVFSTESSGIENKTCPRSSRRLRQHARHSLTRDLPKEDGRQVGGRRRSIARTVPTICSLCLSVCLSVSLPILPSPPKMSRNSADRLPACGWAFPTFFQCNGIQRADTSNTIMPSSRDWTVTLSARCPIEDLGDGSCLLCARPSSSRTCAMQPLPAIKTLASKTQETSFSSARVGKPCYLQGPASRRSPAEWRIRRKVAV